MTIIHGATEFRHAAPPSPHDMDMFKLHHLGTPCSCLFNLDLTVKTDTTGKHPPVDLFKLLSYEACTVAKRAVSILLECFLVQYGGGLPK